MNHQKQIAIVFLVAALLFGCGPAAPAASVAATPVPTIPATESPAPTDVPTLTWFGMQYSADDWHAEPIADNFLIHGVLTHQSLPECQAILLASNPLYTVDKLPHLIPRQPADWPTGRFATEETATENLLITLVITKDEADQELITYYDVVDTSGFFGYDRFRLGYFLLGRSSDPEPCRAAFFEVLKTLQASDWTPLLGVDQG
jgi:hypothetical protein